MRFFMATVHPAKKEHHHHLLVAASSQDAARDIVVSKYSRNDIGALFELVDTIKPGIRITEVVGLEEAHETLKGSIQAWLTSGGEERITFYHNLHQKAATLCRHYRKAIEKAHDELKDQGQNYKVVNARNILHDALVDAASEHNHENNDDDRGDIFEPLTQDEVNALIESHLHADRIHLPGDLLRRLFATLDLIPALKSNMSALEKQVLEMNSKSKGLESQLLHDEVRRAKLREVLDAINVAEKDDGWWLTVDSLGGGPQAIFGIHRGGGKIACCALDNWIASRQNALKNSDDREKKVEAEATPDTEKEDDEEPQKLLGFPVVEVPEVKMPMLVSNLEEAYGLAMKREKLLIAIKALDDCLLGVDLYGFKTPKNLTAGEFGWAINAVESLGKIDGCRNYDDELTAFLRPYIKKRLQTEVEAVESRLVQLAVVLNDDTED